MKKDVYEQNGLKECQEDKKRKGKFISVEGILKLLLVNFFCQVGCFVALLKKEFINFPCYIIQLIRGSGKKV